MKVLITGSKGQLGQALIENKPENIDLILSSRDTFDLTSKKECDFYIKKIKPDLILNAAAYTAVDKAESEEDLAYKINALAPRYFAEIATELGIKLIQISTDFVFDGKQNFPYKPEQERRPLSVYGYTKACGEEFVEKIMGNSNDGTIIRTSWLMGPVGQNFARTILKLLSERDQLKIVSDQVGGPTTTYSLAEYCWQIISLFKKNILVPKILHYTNSGIASWYDIAIAIQEICLDLELLENNCDIFPIKAIDYPTPAIRPSYSVLDCATSINLPGIASSNHWRNALKKVLLSNSNFIA